MSHRICPACKQPATTKKFCTNCGTFLGQPAPTIETAGNPIVLNQNQKIELETSAVLVNKGRLPVKQQAEAAPPPFPFAPGSPSIQNIVENMSSNKQPNPSASTDANSAIDYNQIPGLNPSQAPRKPITSMNPELNRPVPKSWGK